MRRRTPIAIALLGMASTGNTFATECVDLDGDGWGWDGTQSCLVSDASSSLCIDSDGDGFGWDGAATCITSVEWVIPNSYTYDASTTTADITCVDSDGDGYGWDGTATCSVSVVSKGAASTSAVSSDSACVDSDGDGYGWDGTATCKVSVAISDSTTSSDSACVDTDGDGYGWDGMATCMLSVTASSVSTSSDSACVDSDGDGYGWNGSETCSATVTSSASITSASIYDNITDVVLMMGQSNALGEDTLVDESVDAPNDNVIVWTQFDGWQVGNLCTQKWQKAWFPWRGGVCSNHPGFQIAKRIAEKDSSRRIAVIPTGSAGKAISWWDDNGIADQLVNATVTTALGELGKDKVDLIAWSQGESDHGNEVAWALKLDDLISRLRDRSWFDASTGEFIAQETKWSSVNSKVQELDNDDDPLTNWVSAADQPTKDGVHWSGAALRVISDRYANKYLY